PSESADNEKRTIKNIEFYGLNSISPQELTDKMQMKEGVEYSRELLQSDLKVIYETGYFTEKMKAIPSKNDDGTVTVKIVVEENIPVKDFTVE
ncbi:POTRA domain-containing protein, partial [Salmonella enterica subsp. enterica serovar Enteritidis]|uniref:POTRA domain-containing protein n=1 Tax=Salmonella enterica TaxID=28901 RepID=UPI0039E7D760